MNENTMPYYSGSEYLTVFLSRKERRLYRFNPDLTEDERRVIHASILKDAMSTLDFLNCGDLLTTKPKP
jgi:hypothetical protein